MRVANQADLANLIDSHFQAGTLQVNNLCFKQFNVFGDAERAQYLREIYQDKFTTCYSLEEWAPDVNRAISFFCSMKDERHKTHFLIFDETNTLIGRCTLRIPAGKEKISFGIALVASQQNRKYGKAVLETLMKFCFETLQLEQSIFASTMSHNTPSQKLMSSIGMQPHGDITKEIDDALDTVWLEYEMSPSIWRNREHLERCEHPSKRTLRQVILEDYKSSYKEDKRPYSSAEFSRVKFFLAKQLDASVASATPCVEVAPVV